MAVKMTVNDIQMAYQGTLCQYKGSPVYFVSVDGHKECLIMDVETSKLRYVPFKEEDFSNITNPLGFLNFGAIAVYVQRRPVRRMMAGLGGENLEIVRSEFHYRADEWREAQGKVMSLRDPAYAACLKGEYPTIEEAIDQMAKGARFVAIDRQFAVTDKAALYYRAKLVGSVVEKRKWELLFDEGYEYLHKVFGKGFKV